MTSNVKLITAIRLSTLIYCPLLAAFLLLLDRAGDRIPVLYPLLFVPSQIWGVPLALSFCLTFLLERRLSPVPIATLLFLVLYAGFDFHFSPGPRSGPGLVCMTNNIGQNNRESFEPFVRNENPDVIVLQDATYQARSFAEIFPDFYAAGVGEFVLISRYPILRAQILAISSWRHSPVAARFELKYGARSVAIYNVHLPTPRPELMGVRRGAWLRRFIDAGRVSPYSLSTALSARLNVVEQLVTNIEKEKLPYLIMGDLNTPPHGSIYHMFNSRFSDAFPAVGTGFGWTFPGYTRNPLTARGPWLRLDDLFAGSGWIPTYCHVETGRKSQHRAVAARFEPAGS